jgi:hypothetical protein
VQLEARAGINRRANLADADLAKRLHSFYMLLPITEVNYPCPSLRFCHSEMDSLKQRRNGMTINPIHSLKPKRDSRGGCPEPKRLNVAVRTGHTIQTANESPAQNSVSNKNVTWLKTRDENVFHALLSRMGKSYQYRQFLKRARRVPTTPVAHFISRCRKSASEPMITASDLQCNLLRLQ